MRRWETDYRNRHTRGTPIVEESDNGGEMSDPKLEAIQLEVCREFGVPLDYFKHVLELEEDKAHYARRHGLLEDLRKLTTQTSARELPEVVG